RHHLDHLFSGFETHHHTLFRITRDAEVEWFADPALASIRDVVAERVRLRRYEPVVRVEFGPGADPAIRQLLLDLVELTEQEGYELPAPFDPASLSALASLDLPGLRDPPWTPVVPPVLRHGHSSVLSAIRSGDVLVHHPYESFNASVE